MFGANLSGTINFFKLFYQPQLCMPQMTISNFSQLPVPIPDFYGRKIKGVVLDKDNTFADPYDVKVFPKYKDKWNQLRECYPGAHCLIVSNTAGTVDDHGFKQADLIEKKIGVAVLHHKTKKPGCRDEILEYFKKNGICDSPQEIVVVGDRLLTDIMTANLMKSSSIWVSDGVIKNTRWVSKFEKTIYRGLLKAGYKPLRF